MSAPDYANRQPEDSSCAKGDVHTCRKVFWWRKYSNLWAQLCCERRELAECRDAGLA